MKSIINLKYMFSILLAFTACNEDLLEEKPQSQFEIGSFFASHVELDLATTGVYQSFKEGFISTGTGFFVYLDAFSDVFQAQPARFGQMIAGNFLPDDPMMRDQWIRFYTTIGVCNTFIGNAEISEVDDRIKNKSIGEAKFIRALCYYYMVNLWGPVPIIKEKPIYRSGDLNDLTSFVSRPAGIKVVYDFIVSDLQFGAEHCWERGAKEVIDGVTIENRLGRVTKGSAKGLLAKVYLRMATGAKVATRYNSENPNDPAISNAKTGQMDGISAYSIFEDKKTVYLDSCITLCDEVTALGYQLNPNFMTNFNTKDGVESLFEVEAMQALNYGSRAAAYFNPGYTDFYGGTWGGQEYIWMWFLRSTNNAFFTFVKKIQPDNIQNLDLRFYNPATDPTPDYRVGQYGSNIPAGKIKAYQTHLDFSDYRLAHNDCAYMEIDITRHPTPANNGQYFFDIDQANYRNYRKVGNNFVLNRAAPGANGLYLKKYQSAGAASHDVNGANYIILRYSDVLLIKAEALFEKGSANWQAAYDLLVKVHTRDGNQNMTGARHNTSVFDPAFSFPSGNYSDFMARWIQKFPGATDEDKYREAILYERFCELITEGHRFMDILRMGKLTQKRNNMSLGTRQRKHHYFPIPSVEMDSNPKINREDNNPGWEGM